MLTGTTASTVSTSSTIAGTTSTDSTSTSTSAMDEAQDMFLTLLVAQLNNQDPMNPMDNAEMTSQMAQINTVTGIQQVNDTLKSMADQFAAMQVIQGSNMVGHDVLIDGNTLTVQDGKAGGAIDLSAQAESVKVEILSPGGLVLDTLNLGALDAGRHNFEWDASKYTESGSPTFKVTATLGGKTIDSTSMARASVSSVSSDAGVMKVQLANGTSIAYTSVKAIL